jgi:hypothetical protein
MVGYRRDGAWTTARTWLDVERRRPEDYQVERELGRQSAWVEFGEPRIKGLQPQSSQRYDRLW